MNKDLTVGSPSKVLWQFCLPMFGSILFQQLYNIADSLVAGKLIGENALAAVGNSYEITLIFLAFSFGCNIGGSVIVSRYFGAKDYNTMKTAVSTALIGTVVLCGALMAVGLLGCRSLLVLIRTPAELMADSAEYLDIYTLGLPFLFLYNVATGIFTALGDSRTPFLFLAVSSTANIAVDVLFVAAFDMGVAGVAWATFLCQGVSCVLSLWVVARRVRAVPSEGEWVWFSWKMLGQIAVVAIPSILQQSFVSVGNIIIQSVVNSFGASVIAGFAAATKLNNVLISSLTDHAGQRHFQLRLPESGRREERACQGGLRGRCQAAGQHLPLLHGPVPAGRPPAAHALYEQPHGRGHQHRPDLPADDRTLLPAAGLQADLRRPDARLRHDGPLYGNHPFRPVPARGAGHPVFQLAGRERHLAVLACGLVCGHPALHGVLSYLYSPAGRRKHEAVTFLICVKALHVTMKQSEQNEKITKNDTVFLVAFT